MERKGRETLLVEGLGDIWKMGPLWLDHETYEDPLSRYQPTPHPEDKVWHDLGKVEVMKGLWMMDGGRTDDDGRGERKSLETLWSDVGRTEEMFFEPFVSLRNDGERTQEMFETFGTLWTDDGGRAESEEKTQFASNIRRESLGGIFSSASTATVSSGYGEFSSSENDDKPFSKMRTRSTTAQDLQGFFTKFGASAPHVSINYRPRKGKYRKEF